MERFEYGKGVFGKGNFPVNVRMKRGDTIACSSFDLRQTITLSLTTSGEGLGVVLVRTAEKGELAAKIPVRGIIQTLELIPFYAHGAEDTLYFTFEGKGEFFFESFTLFA